MIDAENENVQCALISPPTYLKELCIEEQEINFVYSKIDPLQEDLVSSEVNESIKNDKNDTLELTGSPLEIDLKADESLLLSSRIKNFHLWTEDEENYFPLDLKKARQFINQQFRLKKCEGDVSKPIYVICDGNNVESTVILGAQKDDNFLMSTKVNVLGFLSKEHESLCLKQMVKNHVMNTRVKDCKIKYLSKFRYYLYGTFLQKTKNIYDLEIYGSICIETICNEQCSYDSPQKLLNTKNLILQVIIGHPLSSVQFLWKDLCLLQTFLDILSSPDRYNNPETLLTEEPLYISDVYNEITDAIGYNFLKKEAKTTFSLSKIRVENLLDKLWNILKRCEKLTDLRESFHYLFEELTETEFNLQVSDKDNSNIAAIVSGILKGNLAVPTIKYPQALEFLFELGTEKLKNDYQAIIKNVCPNAESAISAKWSQLKTKLNLQDGFRKTRITVNQKTAELDLNHNITKLAFLGKIHVAVELIYLAKTETSLSEETFDYFCEGVCKSYIEKEPTSSSDFSDLHSSQLCDFDIVMVVPEKELMKSDVPSTWSMKMTSSTNDMEVTTLYHLSQNSIFPMTIYNNYDISSAYKDDSVQFYVTKLEKYKNILR